MKILVMIVLLAPFSLYADTFMHRHDAGLTLQGGATMIDQNSCTGQCNYLRTLPTTYMFGWHGYYYKRIFNNSGVGFVFSWDQSQAGPSRRIDDKYFSLNLRHNFTTANSVYVGIGIDTISLTISPASIADGSKQSATESGPAYTVGYALKLNSGVGFFLEYKALLDDISFNMVGSNNTITGKEIYNLKFNYGQQLISAGFVLPFPMHR